MTCLVDLLYPDVGEATVALLEDAGCDVEFPAAQTCCGQPAFNSGFHDEARRVAATLLDAMEGIDAVVSPSGSCAGMVRAQYPHLFAGTPNEGRARALAARTYELTEYLVDVADVATSGGRWDGRVTYHDSCHGLRELGLSGQGRALVRGVDGTELVEMSRPDLCCGFGGTFSVRMPDVATAMADDKLVQATATAADVMLAGDSGCLMHLQGRIQRSGAPIRAMHVASFLALARGLLDTPGERAPAAAG